MKKIYLLFLFLPLLVLSQNNLVKWYNGNLTPTILENHVIAESISSSGGVSVNNDTSYGATNVFFRSGGWPKPDYNNSSNNILDPLKYVQFTVKPESGYRINLTSFQFNARMQGASGNIEVRCSKTADFSNYSVLKSGIPLSTNYESFNLQFPSNTTVNSGSILYIRIYVYNTENNLHIEHNLSGTVAPIISGKVNVEEVAKPIVNDDRAGTLINTPVLIDILANDTYKTSGALSSINIIQPEHGVIVVNGLKDVTYSPTEGYEGYDVFYYTLTNSAGISNSAKVEIQILKPIEGSYLPLVRWNKKDFTAKIYALGLEASTFTSSNSKQPLSSNETTFYLDKNLTSPQEFNGTPDPSKYLQMSISASDPNRVSYLTGFNMKYGSTGEGNITIKYSKSADFSDAVSILIDNENYSSIKNKLVAFPVGTVLYAGESIYVRVYVYNTWQPTFSIDFTQNGEVGPALLGMSSLIVPEPCKTITTWDGIKWDCMPTINKKAIINGDYNTLKNGSFKSLNLTINFGKLTVTPDNSVTVANEIVVNPAAFLEVQSDANLIQINDVGVNSGNITVQRDIKIGTARTQYNYLGSPVNFATGQNLKTIYPGITFALYHNEANNLFGTSSGANVPGRGLAVKEPTTAGVAPGQCLVTAIYKGVPQNGKIPFALANSNTETNSSLGYNLLGNPYPSNIDLTKLYELNGGNRKAGKASEKIDATFYFWDNEVNNDIALTQQGSDYAGQAYAVFNVMAGRKGTGTSAAGFLNNNVIGAKIPAPVIKVGQGFMTRSLVKGYTLTFNNSIRTDEKADANFLGKAQNQEEEDDRFWLKLISPANLTSTLAVVYFEGGNNTFGPEDSESKGGSDNIFSLLQDKKIAINGKSAFSPSDKIALGTTHYQTGTYTIAATQPEGIFASGQTIYLKDNQTGIITNLSQGAYEFTANAGESTGRFEIIYEPETVLATATKVKEEVVVYRNGANFVLKSENKNIDEIQLFSSAGQLIKVVKPNNKQALVEVSTLPTGVYLLKISVAGKVTTKKIIR